MKVTLWLSLLFTTVQAGFFSWIFDNESNNGKEKAEKGKNLELSKGAVPFEMTMTDEKFIVLADMSPLDVCHHMVVSHLHSTCMDLNEEELGKFAVQLLNCQSEAEERRTFPCTQDMSLADCTRDMDPTVWNAYQIVSNRARAMCYSARQEQFRMKTEYTVNQLVKSAIGQLDNMDKLQEGQEKMAEATSETFKIMHEGQMELMERQSFLKEAQNNVDTQIASNLQELMREKSLIATGNRELAAMTESIKEKLDSAYQKMTVQEQQEKENHLEILADIGVIRERAHEVMNKIDRSSKTMLAYQDAAAEHYKETLSDIAKVNKTLNFVLNTLLQVQEQFERKLEWISKTIGWTGDYLTCFAILMAHLVYFLLALIAASFLQTPASTRVAVLILVPFNAYSEIRQKESLTFLSMTLIITMTILAKWLISNVYHRIERSNHADVDTTVLQNSQSQPISPRITPSPYQSPSASDAGYRSLLSNGLDTPALRRVAFLLESLHSNPTMTPPGKVGNWLATGMETPTVTPPTPEEDREQTGAFFKGPISNLGEKLMLNIQTPKKQNFDNSPINGSSTPNKGYSSRNVSRLSMNSSRSRILCGSLTKTGQPCKLTCTDGSDFCHRHKDKNTSSILSTTFDS